MDKYIYEQTTAAISELCEKSKLKKGNIVDLDDICIKRLSNTHIHTYKGKLDHYYIYDNDKHIDEIKIAFKYLKEIKYKVRYQDEQEIERVIISENILREPIDKIIQISTKVVSRSTRVNAPTPAALAASVEGIEPKVVSLNTSAYCACMSCCGKTNGITSSGAVAKEWYTIAAGPGYPIGTVVYIPALADKPNGGWFVVEDRGGAISNNKIDIYMGSHSSAIIFGRRNLQCYVY